MRTFSTSDILEMWEKGRPLHPLDRGLLALSTALPSLTDDLADWPLGRRNRALFDLYCKAFGSRLHGWTSCPSCGEKIEFDLDASVLLSTQREEPGWQEMLTVGNERFRLPTSRDLAEVMTASDARPAARRLLERCRESRLEPLVSSDATLEEVEERMASADPMADIRLVLPCPTCGHQWDGTLDIARFVWAEIESRARRLLLEVHHLARAYGWTEAETLSLPAARRAMYLEMVQA
ncbi:MAG: hypothetical protein CV088_02645 [Nitrospira sp. LK70]|nr:hypothetical protein [Nitrospira sp. LK70]